MIKTRVGGFIIRTFQIPNYGEFVRIPYPVCYRLEVHDDQHHKLYYGQNLAALSTLAMGMRHLDYCVSFATMPFANKA